MSSYRFVGSLFPTHFDSKPFIDFIINKITKAYAYYKVTKYDFRFSILDFLSYYWSLSKPPENIRKLEFFYVFRGYEKRETNGMK